LFYLILGESLLNDAIGIAVFKTASHYIGRPTNYIHVLIFLLDFIICCVGSCTIGNTTIVVLVILLLLYCCTEKCYGNKLHI
jgi:NhaP-type Na+/H+ or K+/H+ antiporter